MSGGPRVVPFREEARDELVRFCVRYPAYQVDRPTLEMLFTTYLESDDAIVEVWDDSERRLVGSVLAYDNADDAAELIVLGYRPGAALEAVIEAALARAEQVVRQTPASHLEIIIPEVLAAAADAMRACGYRQCHRWLTMDLPAISDCALLHTPPPAAMSWADVDEHNVAAAHNCYLRSFATVTGGQVPPLDKFREVALAAEPPRFRVLSTDDGVVGFVRMMCHGERGEIRVLGRHPDCSVRGVGSAALAEGLRQLSKHGAEAAFLEVASDNPAAVGLYRKFGFVTAKDLAVFRKAAHDSPQRGGAS